jgi:hypothetical protein
MVYPTLQPLMRTPRLPVVDWTDAPADLNGLVRFAERLNLVSARVLSHFKRSLPCPMKQRCQECWRHLISIYIIVGWNGNIIHEAEFFAFSNTRISGLSTRMSQEALLISSFRLGRSVVVEIIYTLHGAFRCFHRTYYCIRYSSSSNTEYSYKTIFTYFF